MDYKFLSTSQKEAFLAFTQACIEEEESFDDEHRDKIIDNMGENLKKYALYGAMLMMLATDLVKEKDNEEYKIIN
jgi:hypothetical protein